jgi:hypothetical protein
MSANQKKSEEFAYHANSRSDQKYDFAGIYSVSDNCQCLDQFMLVNVEGIKYIPCRPVDDCWDHLHAVPWVRRIGKVLVCGFLAGPALHRLRRTEHGRDVLVLHRYVPSIADSWNGHL